jgi:hypothetical protein
LVLVRFPLSVSYLGISPAHSGEGENSQALSLHHAVGEAAERSEVGEGL